jgi:copper chaperone NosL
MTAHYVNDYTQDNVLIPAKTAFFISEGTIQSPMRGGVIAFSSENDAKEFGIKFKAKPITWEAIIAK